MPGLRRRWSTWIAVAAMVLSLVPAAGAHAPGGGDRLGDHDDYCSVTGVVLTSPGKPQLPDQQQRVCTHCDGCTGHSGSVAAPPKTASLTALVAPGATTIAHSPPAAFLPADLIAAPPRGPPRAA